MKNICFDKLVCYCVSLLALITFASANEFTFDLPDSAQDCFYEVIEAHQPVTFEFQVVSGGSHDVDVVLESPSNNILYKEIRKEYDTHSFNTTESGEYSLCFSNEFSTFTHKTVFLAFNAGPEKPLLPQMDDQSGPLTFMENTAYNMHISLNEILEAQTHHRLAEASGRKFAEDLNERVLWWSILQTCVILVIGLSQVLILRNFFSYKPSGPVQPVLMRKPRYAYGYTGN